MHLDLSGPVWHGQEVITFSPEQSARVGKAIVKRRTSLGLRQKDLVVPGLISIGLVQHIENASRPTFRELSLASIENRLGWESGSIEAIADGGDPTVKADTPDSVGPSLYVSRSAGQDLKALPDDALQAERDRINEEIARRARGENPNAI